VRPMAIVNARLANSPLGTGLEAGLDTGLVDIRCNQGRIDSITPAGAGGPPAGEGVHDADGRVALPAFVDCHTHACWAGDRLDEWDRKRAGASYLEILRSGGGIMSTVRAVRSSSEQSLSQSLLDRLVWMSREGTLAVEVKSGYGLTTADELKMLRAITSAGEQWIGTVVPTACIGHAIDTADPAFVERTIRETLPAVHDEFPGIAIDGYCENGAWSFEDTVRLLDRAMELGHPVRIHADQFTSLGVVAWAARRRDEGGAVISVDHLEATAPADLRRLAESGVFGVMLPCSGMHVDGRFADGRCFLDAGGRLAIATNWNPGSAPCPSVPMAIALAVRHLGLTPDEAIAAATKGGADLLGLDGAGRLEVGARADLVVLEHRDARELAYTFGGRPVRKVFAGGFPIDS